MKKVYIIHGWEGYPDEGWFPWLKKELETKGFQVTVPQLPETDRPTLQKWLPYLQNLVKKPDQETYFVCHSLGCITTLRYLESLPESQKIGGVVLVGGFGHDLEYKGYKGELRSFFALDINWDKIKNQAHEFVAIHSDNDPWVPIEHNQIYVDKLGAKSIIEHNKFHFSGDDGINQLPSALVAVLEMTN